MKLSISNIGWAKENDELVYDLMSRYGFQGLEIAPTRIYSEKPYDRILESKVWSRDLKVKYGFFISSMQSIWYGRQEKIFGNNEERKALLDYTKKAIGFAASIGCKNLVFGCPRNRNLPDGADGSLAIAFFKELGDYAYSMDTVIGMEANPPIYNTNFINTTESAIELIKRVDSKGFLLNLDMGTMIENCESMDILKDNEKLINHVHISEPELKPIQHRNIHRHLADYLCDTGYDRFVSIEVGRQDDVASLDGIMKYVRSIFG